LALDFTREPDLELADVARRARLASIARWPTPPTPPLLRALERVPREDFVRLEDVARSADDRAFALDDDGGSTVSAMHAYVRAFEALGLADGDTLVELGAGTGYGAALGAEVVGERGRVLAIELVAPLVEVARERLRASPNVEVACADAHDVARWRGARRVNVGFALERIPPAWLDALAEGGVLVAPVRDGEQQLLARVEKREGGTLATTSLGPVRFVVDRSGAPEKIADELAPDGR
jgi:protein-L-isoaspartate(D-aspartate) O-methyltransferase